jgi:hypothetical protein
MTGLIAFFDILGYQSFLENNSASDSALNVLDLINKIPAESTNIVSSIWLKRSAETDTEMSKQITSAQKHLIFSDTIVLSIEYPTSASQLWKDRALAYLTFLSGKLCCEMFTKGLPLRGAMVEGEFVVKDTCFAGKAIVEAYNLCESLDFSGFVYSQHIGQRVLKKDCFTSHNFDRFFIPYLSPINKSSKEEKLVHFNWTAYLNAEDQKVFLTDVEKFVLRSFWAHEKDCSLSVDTKIRNTVKLAWRLAIALEIPG